MQSDIKQRTIIGMMWSAFQKFGTLIISFVSNIVLARLLAPDDFGCVGMLAIFISLSFNFIDSGFGSALIQKKEPTEADYSTIFHWNLVLSFALYSVLFFSAPAIARFYRLEVLSSVLRAEGVILIIHALSIIQSNQLRKQLRFKQLALINIVSSFLSLILTIVLAKMGWGVWALVAQQVSMSLVSTIMLWGVNSWRPRFLFSWSSFKELFGFGGYILASSFVNSFCDNVQGLLIGRFYNASTMGYYSQAYKLEQVASKGLADVIAQVTYPVFAEYQNNKKQLVMVLQRFIWSLAFISFPLMLLLIVIAEPLIILLYSAKWIACVPFFQVLCVAGIAISMQGVNYYAVAALGKSDVIFRWTIVKRLVGLLFIVLGLVFGGIKGLLLGMVASSYNLYFVNAWLSSKYTGYKLSEQIKDLLPIIIVSSISFLIALSLKFFISDKIFVRGAIQTIVFLVSYLGISSVLKIKAVESCSILFNTIRSKFSLR